MQQLQGEKYLWCLPTIDKKKALEFSASYAISLPLVEALFSRGLSEKKVLQNYFFSSFEKDVFDPQLMKDAEKAVFRILKAIERQEKILIFGDYDVDGITSSALMMICLLPLGAKVNFFLPNRLRDGYGISNKIIKRASDNNYKVIVTVDNGITAFKQAEYAKELGIDLIITDHHRQHDILPDAYAIVNPNQNSCQYPYKKFAGVGVAFKLLSLLYDKKGLTMPVKAYELLLLGTVADVVPLTGENRFWVRYCLQYVNKKSSYALNLLKKNGKITKEKISSTDIGFSITPQINALGRLEDPRQGVKFLVGSDKKETDEVAMILLKLNQARRDIEKSIFNEVKKEIEIGNIDLNKEKIIVAASKNWAPGVIGLVASRIVAEYGRPTLLFHLTKNGEAKGSCRSIEAFNIFNALQESKDLLKTFGGHSLAAGLALKIDNLPKLKKNLEKLINEQLTEFDLKQKLLIDAQISTTDLTQKFMKDMQLLEPFGNSNAEPLFVLKNIVLIQPPKLLKDLHVKCTIFADGVIKSLIFFNRPKLFEKLLNYQDKQIHVIARVIENHWNNKVNIELIGVDISFS